MTTLSKSLALAALALGFAISALPASAQEAVAKEKTGFSNGVGSNAANKPADDKGLLRSAIDNARERGDLRREQRRDTVDKVLDNAKERQDDRKDRRADRQDRRVDRKVDRLNRRVARLQDKK